MKGCMPNTVKYLLFAANFLVCLTGLVTLAVSIYAVASDQSLAQIIQADTESDATSFKGAVISLILISVVVVIVSFLGCCGTLKENRIMLFLYFSFLLVIFFGIVVAATMALTGNLDALKRPLYKSMNKFQNDAAVKTAWDNFQTEFQCCGVDSYHDWQNVSQAFPDTHGYLVPASCCFNIRDDLIQTCLKQPSDPQFIGNMDGCFAKLKSLVSDNKRIIGLTCIAIIVFLFLNMILLFGYSLCLMPKAGYQPV